MLPRIWLFQKVFEPVTNSQRVKIHLDNFRSIPNVKILYAVETDGSIGRGVFKERKMDPSGKRLKISSSFCGKYYILNILICKFSHKDFLISC